MIDGKMHDFVAARRAVGWIAAAVWVGGLLSWPSARGAELPSAEQLVARVRTDHPRLLIDRDGFAALRERVDRAEPLRAAERALAERARRLLNEPPVNYVIPDGKRLLATSREVLQRVYTLALSWRLHGRPEHRERLWRELQAVADFQDWNPSHFLDTAEMTHAVAIAYDWLYDDWSDQQRTTIRAAIVRHGLEPGLRVYQSGSGWPTVSHNWNQVCNGGMIMGALALAQEEPQRAGTILRAALTSVPRAMGSYAPDGGWDEGPSYWVYATNYNVLLIAALESALGDDFGLSQAEGLATAGLFPLYMTGPTGRVFNFADGRDSIRRNPALLWLGQRFHLPACNWWATHRLEPDPLSLVWYHDAGRSPSECGLPLDRYWRKVEVVSLRSSWDDPRALFLGLQAGSNRANHNHLDLGSFVLDALGQRWVVDLGRDDYNLPGYFGGNRYTYYRLRAEGHNTLVISPREGPDQDPRGAGKVVDFQSTRERGSALVDLTGAYEEQARRVTRHVVLDRAKQQVELTDTIELRAPADVWWMMHTPAHVALRDRGRRADLRIGAETLAAVIDTPDGAEWQVLEARPLPGTPDPPGQADNSQVSRLAIRLSLKPAQEPATIRVRFVPQAP